MIHPLDNVTHSFNNWGQMVNKSSIKTFTFLGICYYPNTTSGQGPSSFFSGLFPNSFLVVSSFVHRDSACGHDVWYSSSLLKGVSQGTGSNNYGFTVKGTVDTGLAALIAR